MRHIFAAVLSLLLVGAVPQSPSQSNSITTVPVSCGGGGGTATILNGTTFITNAHVITGCAPYVNGVHMPATYIDIRRDIVLLGDGRDFGPLVCEGLGKSMGFASGHPAHNVGVSISQIFGYDGLDPMFDAAAGFVYPGMSGGSITKADGTELYGVIRAKDGHKIVYYIPGDEICLSVGKK